MFKPHLCTDADLTRIKFPIYVLAKIDGCRMLVVNGKAVGRSLKSYKNKKLTEYFSREELSGLDGELVEGCDLTSQSLCRDTTSLVNTIDGEVPELWMVFDYNTEHTKHLPYSERYHLLKSLVQDINDPRIRVVHATLIHSVSEVEEYYADFLAEGFEGVILRSPDGLHKSGRCTANEAAYTRMKPSSDKDAIVISFIEAEENLNEAKVNELGRTERSSHQENKVGKGMVGSIIAKDLSTGDIITVGAGKMTHEERKEVWDNADDYVGKAFKYTSMDVGVKDKPRFPRWIVWRNVEDISE